MKTLWTIRAAPRAPLRRDAAADVCVIGAGVAGLTTAYLLARRGQSVVVLEAGEVGGGESARTTAHLATALDRGWAELERVHGTERCRLAAQSHAAAIDEIGRICAEEEISCAFERLDGWLVAEGSVRALEREFAAARRAGLPVEWARRAPLGREGDGGRVVRFPAQGQLEPDAYLAGLADAVERRGGTIFGGTRVLKVAGGFPLEIETARGPRVTAAAAVVATNAPISDHVAVHTDQASTRTYVLGAPIPAQARALWWDTADPFHYVRTARARGGNSVLLVGGEDHPVGHAGAAPERFERLERWARLRFPTMGPARWRWSGELRETIDGLGFIGRDPAGGPNVFIATGDCGNGMTHGTIAGMLLRDLLCGEKSPWAEVYDPARRRPRSLGRWLRRNADAALQYAAYLTPGEADAVPRDAGRVVRRGASKRAVYRSQRGRRCELSAVCTHLGGIVAWNPVEKTWDCPVHGSRFDAEGRVLDGPAVEPLARAAPRGRRRKRRAIR